MARIHEDQVQQAKEIVAAQTAQPHKVVGLYSGDTYLSGTLDECENYVAHEPAESFKIVPL